MKNKILFNQTKQLLIFQLKSPLFYIIAILMPVISGINFYIQKQFFTSTGSTDLVLFFSIIPYLSTIVIPAICYKPQIFSYENFVPLTKYQRIFTYFLSCLISFSIIFIFTSLASIPVCFFGDFDISKFLTSIFCLFIFSSAIISICIFVNELISSKIAALIISIFILIIINFAHLVSLYVPVGEFFSEILKKISIAWHFDAAGKGIFDTRDYVWLCGTTVLFLTLTFFIQELKSENHNKNFKILYTGVLLLISLIMLNGNRYYKRIDFSKNQTYSLSKYTKQLINEIKNPLKITYYRSGPLTKLYPQIRDISDFLVEYSTKSKNISLLIKDPDNDKTITDLLESYGILSQQMRTVKNNSTEFINVYSAIIIEYQGRFEAIPFSLSADTLEYDLDGRIKHLLYNKERSVNIILGNSMNFQEDYSYLVPWLSSQGFICNPIFINDPNFVEILENSNGLLFIIGDSDIDIEKAIAIENYILCEKGNALFNISPYQVDISGSWNLTQNKKTNLVEMLENWGLQFQDKIAADISCSSITMYSQEDSDNPLSQNSTHAQILNYPMWINLLPQENCKLGATLFWATPITINSQNVTPYLVSSTGSYNYDIDKKSPQKMIETNPFVLNTVNISQFAKESQIMAVEISGKISGLYNLLTASKEKIVVIPDQYFLNTLMTGYNSMNSIDYRNFELTTNILLKLNNETELAELQSKSSVDTSLFKISDPQRFIQLQIFTYILVFLLLPILTVLFSVFVLFILKRV